MPEGIPEGMDLFEWLFQLGIGLQGDPTYYSSGQATEAEFKNLFTIATREINKLADDNPVRSQYYQFLEETGAITGDPGYYAGGEAGPGEFDNLIDSASASFGSGGGGGISPKALPRNAKLVKVGNQYRVVWSLGGGLGWAWYAISADQLKNIYETTTPDAHFSVGNVGQFEAQFGNNYWGNIAEVNLSHDNPWEDLKQRIFDQFGFVAGFDDPEIQRLLIQAYFEDWNQNQFLVQYRDTDFYQETTTAQRQWMGLSEAERNQLIRDTSADLSRIYESYWGNPIDWNDPTIADAAFKIASGQMTQKEWEYTQRQQAGSDENTPEGRKRREEEEAQRAEGNQIENFTLYAENLWRSWVGPSEPPPGFGTRWGEQLASGRASEADLENYLRDVANSRWVFKPENATWEDWAAPYKSEIRQKLELGSVDDNDSLLGQILNTDLNGVDVNQLIRQDSRFRSTRTMYNELSTYAEEIGRRFGFIT